jgi:hypothetical protein
MMTPKKEAYKTQAETIIKALKRRGMDGIFCETAKDALKEIEKMIPDGSTVSFGGSMTLSEAGIMTWLQGNENITLYDRSKCKDPEEVKEVYHKALTADYYLMSTNAITLDGELINIDGTGNRVAALIYGPENVIVIAGMNKVASDIEAAYKRVKNIASPPNCIRLNRKTPCAVTGKCGDCLGAECICSQTVITRRSAVEGRIKVVLVGEELGY